MAYYFTVVGTTPIACANALSWYVRTGAGPEIEDVFFIASSEEKTKRSSSAKYIRETLRLARENLKRMAPEALDELTFHEDTPTLIPEADLGVATRLIAEGILAHCPSDTTAVIDATGGRKMMTASAILAGIVLSEKHKRHILFSYYWLKRFTRDMLGKRAYELGLDEAETVVKEVSDINDEIKKIG